MAKDEESLFEFLKTLDTEQRNPATMKIDLAEAEEIARMINREDAKVAGAVEQKIPAIGRAIERVKEALENGGRLIYVGAGTSGRLGVLDAAECPPTFGSPPEQVIGLIAGGESAMFRAREGAEDSEEEGRAALRDLPVQSRDVVCGLAASGRTPFVHGALKEAGDTGCGTILVTTVPGDQVRLSVDVMIDVPVGPEVIMGSTRMKSATAQKMVLNMITTGAMIRRGKIYENVMVDLMLTNRKLEERARRILMMFADIGYEEAGEYLDAAEGNVKTAMVMCLGSVNRERARTLLEEHNGFVRETLQHLGEER